MGIADDVATIRTHGWRTIAVLVTVMESEIERALGAAVGLSLVEYTVIDVLGRHDVPVRMRDIALEAGHSPSSTTRLVSRLEDRGFVTRVAASDDRRGVASELTAEGRLLWETSRPLHDEIVASVLREADVRRDLAPVADAFRAVGAF
ncbi:MarR family winged helix-turn-helix transcriptional regulator [Agromyces atrinae]|uniref:MarR family transcriptional regulator n=1 Tax=Agromyces atrinae TaxID=592376 RepID=A0A4Q2M810_9MICO|nr:MarR family transcriptional regulator [Agromyces atrinae]NYD67580.1 DNA-binding MarR family transcriptional regulator [Agromyces atrinae]RXZ88209.1 MarR family transcriptional regulator [Agromyces atrinae]